MENLPKGTARFIVEGDAEKEVELALLPGLADSVEKLKSWGYPADVIASNESSPRIIDMDSFGWEDFVKLVRSNTILISNLVIQNMTYDPSIFDKYVIFSSTRDTVFIGDILKLGDFLHANAFDRSRITINFAAYGRSLSANATLYMSMTIPAKAKFELIFFY